MEDIRFYEEFVDEKTRKISQGTVVAALVGNGPFTSGTTPCYEAMSGVYMQPNSPVATSSVAIKYLKENCRRVSEARARQIHPALFHRLDNGEA
jgi:hypothetical protein